MGVEMSLFRPRRDVRTPMPARRGGRRGGLAAIVVVLAFAVPAVVGTGPATAGGGPPASEPDPSALTLRGSLGDRNDPEDVGYVLERGRARRIAFPGAAGTIAAGINDGGEIVGKYKNADGRDRGFLRTRRGRYRRIDVPGATGTEAYKINNRGQIVGSYNPNGPSAGDPGSKGFVLTRGRFITIDFPGAVFTQALGIDDAGIVVGEYLDSAGNFHGYRWDRGRFSVIEVAGSTISSVGDINDHGDIVGVSADGDGGPHAFVLRNRPRPRVETVDVPGARYSLGLGINNRRDVVGAAANDLVSGSDTQGFLLTGGITGTFAPIEIRGTTRTAPLDVNNRGQIIAGILPTSVQ
jgi:probable HAF family extracellular repeat protein